MNEDMLPFIKEVVGFNVNNYLLETAVYNYLLYGIQPGSFTQALLENNLFSAASRADNWNRDQLGYIALEISKRLPEAAIGNPVRVKDWMARNNALRDKYRDFVLQQATMLKLKNA